MLVQTDTQPDGPLEVESTRYGDDVLVVSLSGELDLAVVATAKAALEAASAGSGDLLIVDLGELEFIDASGVSVLHELARARPDADRLRLLRSRHPGVNRVLDLTGVGSMLSMVPSG